MKNESYFLLLKKLCIKKHGEQKTRKDEILEMITNPNHIFVKLRKIEVDK